MSVFTTIRPASVQEIIDRHTQENLDRQINLDLLKAKNDLERQAVAEQAAMEQDSYDAAKEAEKQAALESLAQATRLENARTAYIEAAKNMPEASRKYLIKTFLTGIITESLWVDDNVKCTEESQTQITEALDQIINKCEDVTGTSLLENMKKTKLLSYIDEAVTYVSSGATERILREAADTGEITIDFKLNDDEADELFNKLTELNPDKISQSIRDKVLDTVKDEKECGQVKAELFKEIDDADNEVPDEGGTEEPTTTETPEEPEDTTEDDAEETAESLIGAAIETVARTINAKTGTLPAFGIRVLTKLGDKESLHGNYDNAYTCYTEAAQLCTDLRNSNAVYMPTEYERLKDSIANALNARRFAISESSGRARIRDSFEAIYESTTISNSLDDLRKYNRLMATAVKSRNIVNETPEQSLMRMNNNRISTLLTKNTGNSLFESLMMSNIHELEQSAPVLEGGLQMVSEEVENAAMLQTLLEYTIYETLNTMKVFEFTPSTVKKLQVM